jgi:hypothetical protein
MNGAEIVGHLLEVIADQANLELVLEEMRGPLIEEEIETVLVLR